MDMKHSISNSDTEIRCFNVVNNPSDNRYGEKCNRLLMKKNSQDKAAGQIKCPVCKAVYEIIDDKICLISRGN